MFGPFATHWEWTRFVEFDNYWWWNLGIYVWSGNQATINAVEVNIISKTTKITHESFEFIGHIDCFLWYAGYCDNRMGTQRPDGKSAILQWSLDEISWTCEKETTGIMDKRVDFAQDNAPAHNALSLKQFLANKNITVLEHPPYSPDLALCNFCRFPKIKSALKGTHFVSVENVKAKRRRSSTASQSMTCGIALNIGSIICSCVSTQKGNILKGIVVDFLNLLNGKSYRHRFVFFVGPRIYIYIHEFITCEHTHTHTHTHTYIHIYIYIYREREREKAGKDVYPACTISALPTLG